MMDIVEGDKKYKLRVMVVTDNVDHGCSHCIAGNNRRRGNSRKAADNAPEGQN